MALQPYWSTRERLGLKNMKVNRKSSRATKTGKKTSRTGASRNRTPLAVKEKFITLRARGHTLKKIGEELGIHKTTLIEWGKDFRDEIANARAIELEALRERFFLSTELRLELYGEEVRRIREELRRRDYSDVPTSNLVKLLLDTYGALKEEDVEPILITPEEAEQDRAAELVILKLTAGTSCQEPNPIRYICQVILLNICVGIPDTFNPCTTRILRCFM